MEKYAVFLDIDGTLAKFDNFPNGGTVSEENVKAICEIQQKGHFVFLNTGRSYAWINKAVLNSAEFDGVISGMGTQILFRGQPIYEKLIDRTAIRNILEVLCKTKNFLLLGGTDHVFTLNSFSYPIETDITPIYSPDDFEVKYPDAKIQKVEFFETSTEIKKVLEENLQFFHHKDYSEGCPHGVSKAKAMLIAAQKLDIPVKNCIAMGDSINDIDMLTAAGISVAMGDADEKVKRLADFVSLSCAENGVAYAIKKLILDKE